MMAAEAVYRILIVDDSEEDRHTFRRYLTQGRDKFYEILEAATATEGLARCNDQNPDCILLDYNLPDLDGVEFINRLNGATTEIPPAVVMLTGQGNEAVAVRAMKAGAQDYLVKGLANSGINHAIHTAIENVILRRRVVEQERNVKTLAAERASMISELAARATALAEADVRKDEFLATLAHELRNPLAPISNAINLLLQSAVSREAAQQLYQVMHRQIRHMVRLIDDLMEISRITRGKLELRLHTTELNAAIQHAVETSEPFFRTARQDFSCVMPRESLWVNGDEIRLAQIFTNLLSNAAKYTEKGGRIRLTARREGTNAIVSVTDTGVGIPAEMLIRVFDVFTQVDNSVGRAQGGLGIGLTLAMRLATLHGGTLVAKSDGIGKGSEFVVTLPLTTAATAPQARDAPPKFFKADPLAAKHRVLIVDDNRDAADSLAMLIGALGADTLVVNDGLAALAALAKYSPDIVVLDIGMPGMDGYQLAAAIRKLPEFSGTLLVGLTGYGQSEDIKRAHAAGMDRHLVKPVEMGTLQSLLSSLDRARFQQSPG
jgi:signal transduction histidine kinase